MLLIKAVAVGAMFLAGVFSGFEQGQANPEAKSFTETKAEPKPAERLYGVDAVK
jgi:hypothetical protein